MQCAANVDYVCDVIPASTENIQLHSKKKKDSKYEYYEDSIDDDAVFLHGAKMAKLLQY